MLKYNLLSLMFVLWMSLGSQALYGAGMPSDNAIPAQQLEQADANKKLLKEQKRTRRILKRLEKKMEKWEQRHQAQNGGLSLGAILGIIGLVLVIIGIFRIGLLLLVLGIILLALGLVFGLLGLLF